MLAASLACGRGAVASHLSAGAAWSLPDISDGLPEVSVPIGRRPRPAGVIVHQKRLSRRDTTRLGIIPVTTPARTLIDLASCVSDELLEQGLDDALRRGLVTAERMVARLEDAGRAQGVGRLRDLVAARAHSRSVPGSPLETRFERLARRAGVPPLVRQYHVTDGRRRAFLDFAWPDLMLAVEVDGYRFHSGRQKWEDDRARGNMLTLLGWRVIHVTARDLDEPKDLVERLRAAHSRATAP